MFNKMMIGQVIVLITDVAMIASRNSEEIFVGFRGIIAKSPHVLLAVV